MFGNKHHKPQNRIDSLIGHGTSIEGDLHFSGGLRVDGTIKGNVIATGDKPGTLVLSEKAVIEGSIRVGHLIVNGRIHGPVLASHYLELQPKSQVTGDIHYRTLEMHPGAIIEGQLLHLQDSAELPVIAITHKTDTPGDSTD